ncbi:unnamed protein product, partial [Porites lobata]
VFCWSCGFELLSSVSFFSSFLQVYRGDLCVFWSKIIMASPASVNRSYVEQLRLEANFVRTPVSKTAQALAQYVEENMNSDPLVTGVSSSLNPYKEKSSWGAFTFIIFTFIGSLVLRYNFCKAVPCLLDFIMSYVTTSETYRLQKIVVDQLRTEKNVRRIKVSEAANELKSYVEKIQREDPLVTGVPGNQNPFKEKSSCTLI